MLEDTDRQLIFGVPDEWKDFERRHFCFFARFPHLRDALNTAFIRTGTSSTAIDKFVFLYGRLCSEDFLKLCCAAEMVMGQQPKNWCGARTRER
jgi:hypothetical protein